MNAMDILLPKFRFNKAGEINKIVRCNILHVEVIKKPGDIHAISAIYNFSQTL